MLILITAGRGVGHEIDAVPAYALARINGGTAVAIGARRDVETTAIDPANERAVAREQDPPKRKPVRR
jgi:hypothetical protein